MLEPGQLDGVAQQDDAAKLRLAIHVLEKANRPLHFRDQVVKDRPHRLEHSPWILGFACVALEMLRLGEGQLEFLGQLFGEVVAANRNASLPNAKTVGDDQVARFSSHRENHQ